MTSSKEMLKHLHTARINNFSIFWRRGEEIKLGHEKQNCRAQQGDLHIAGCFEFTVDGIYISLSNKSTLIL